MSETYVPAALRRLVQERARLRCEYCLIPDSAAFLPHEIDHIVAEKHGGETVEENLAWSCAVCNKHKGSDLTSIDPDSGEIVPLFHPRHDRWSTHFTLDGPVVRPLTSTGRVTERLLQFNQFERIEERKVLIAAGLIQTPNG